LVPGEEEVKRPNPETAHPAEFEFPADTSDLSQTFGGVETNSSSDERSGDN
jgi:hypothetical protein